MMQVSAKTEYGLRCLLLLAKQNKDQSLSIGEIAEQEHLPRPYAEQILLQLRRAGVVKSIRGTQGGFILSQAPHEVSVGSVIRHLEGVPFENTCNHFNKKSSCGHLGDCSIRPVWEIVSSRLWQALDAITLDQLLSPEETVAQTLEKRVPTLSGAGSCCSKNEFSV